MTSSPVDNAADIPDICTKTWNRPEESVWNDVAGLLQRATDNHLPVSVRYLAAEAATSIVNAWFACETYDDWIVQMGRTV